MWSTKKFNKEIGLLRQLSAADDLPTARKAQLKQVLLQRLSTETRQSSQRYIQQERGQTFMRYLIATLLGLSLVGGTAFASNSAKPGDLLFPVKKAREQLEVTFATSDQAKANLQSQFAEERVNELLEVQAHASSTAPSTQVAAQTEASSAIDTLLHVQADLQAKGNTTAAAALGETIARLQAKLNAGGEDQDTQHGHDDNNNGDHGNNHEQENDQRHSSSTVIQLNDSENLHSTTSSTTNFQINVHGDSENETDNEHTNLPAVQGTSTVHGNLNIRVHNEDDGRDQ